MALFSKSEKSSSAQNAAGSKASNKFSGNKTWFMLAIIAALAAVGLVFGILASFLATTTYYVLNTDVPARSQITQDMLTKVSASEGTQPRNALGLEDVSYQDIFAKVELNAGDVISASNTGDLIPLHSGIPDDYVVASFVVDPNNAVGGKLNAGTYIDILATTDNSGNSKTTKAALRHVLVMDVTANASDFEESEDVTDETSAQDSLRAGLPFLYTVALTEEDAAILANIREDNLFVTLSSLKSDTSFTDKSVKTDSNVIFGDNKVGNSGEGTDPKFGKVETEDNTTVVPDNTK